MTEFFFFAELSRYVMSKPQGQRVVVMQAIMREIQVEQEKAFASRQTGKGGPAKVQHVDSVETYCHPSLRASLEKNKEPIVEPEVSDMLEAPGRSPV